MTQHSAIEAPIYYPAKSDATNAIGQYVGSGRRVAVAGRKIGEEMRMVPVGHLQRKKFGYRQQAR